MTFREAVDCLEAYQQFQPEHFDRRAINTHLRALALVSRGDAMKVKVQVVTHHRRWPGNDQAKWPVWSAMI